ncbi:SDR family oxidoreductase [Stenotrophomonas sp. 24(2023)]|uniref:SDR family oxidoreductase n=1 Tax=Stenotrophomonas sp. 24(2023) TaxID=3068324 RepID=UPI0027DFF543|nr:SDR family oxidoreductase [Stenotrophomonas sp. 24(2023)]WMJ68391.1 SDR family oxidoreductase [Stenotrophomonas sp. 24(2023)]
MSKLAGKVAVVTGGNSGIGLAAAKRFVAEGATVFITGRREADLARAAQDIGGNVITVQGDIGMLADLDRLYDTVREKAGHIDVLFANAGGGSFAPLGGITEAHFDQIFNTNVKGTLFSVQKALPLLKDGASIIITGSTTSVMGTPAFSVYSATKAAVRNFARSWVLDLKERKIRVNVLSPGPVVTPGLLGVAPAGQADALVAAFAEQIPLGRAGDADEIGKVAVFLASDDSSFVNGVELFADGGLAQV